jgi:hypothetical protein
MAEIKSTLDLVMERTRGLSMSDREKKEMKKKDLSDKIRALLERFINDYMGMKWLEAEFNDLGMGKDPKIRQLLKDEILKRVGSNGSNPEVTEKLLDALEEVAGVRADACRDIIAAYGGALTEQKRIFSEKMKDGLSAQGISGSAVVPNIEADPGWTAAREKLAEDFRQKIESV